MVGVRLALVLALLAACGSDLDDAFDHVLGVASVSSVSIRRDGEVVREAYPAGGATTPHDVRSVTKTVTALLIGAAIDTGCVASVDQPIGALLGVPVPGDPVKAAITVRDLLTMSSGFAWAEDGASGYNSWIQAPDQVEYVLLRPLDAEPGETFNYNSGALHLLSAILSHACAPTAAFADQHLFGPLGIASPTWEVASGGITNGAAGLELTNPELAAIGQLILDHGAGVISAGYVDAMIEPQIATGYPEDGTPAYGYGIWIGSHPAIGAFALAEGYGGQFIGVVPQARAVVVVTTAWEGLGARANDNFLALYHVLVTELLPAL